MIILLLILSIEETVETDDGGDTEGKEIRKEKFINGRWPVTDNPFNSMLTYVYISCSTENNSGIFVGMLYRGSIHACAVYSQTTN